MRSGQFAGHKNQAPKSDQRQSPHGNRRELKKKREVRQHRNSCSGNGTDAVQKSFPAKSGYNQEKIPREEVPFMHIRQKTDTDHGTPDGRQDDFIRSKRPVPAKQPYQHQRQNHHGDDDGGRSRRSKIEIRRESVKIWASCGHDPHPPDLKSVDSEDVPDRMSRADGGQTGKSHHAGDEKKISQPAAVVSQPDKHKERQKENCLQFECECPSQKGESEAHSSLNQKCYGHKTKKRVDGITLSPQSAVQNCFGGKQHEKKSSFTETAYVRIGLLQCEEQVGACRSGRIVEHDGKQLDYRYGRKGNVRSEGQQRQVGQTVISDRLPERGKSAAGFQRLKPRNQVFVHVIA